MITVLVIAFTIAGCESPQRNEPEVIIRDDNQLGMLAYISTALLEERVEENIVSNSYLTQLSMFNNGKKNDSETDLEDELDRINVYVDKLKSFIEHGTEGFGSITEQESDRPEYEFMLKVIVEEEEYILYYNYDPDTGDSSGVFIMDGTEYEIDAEETVLESISEEDESKTFLQLMVRNGSDMIIISYESKQEEGESKQIFSLKSSISNNVEIYEIELKTEEDEFVLTITEGENVFKFKYDTEDEEASYKLDYIIDGTRGKVRIVERTNEDGETFYIYRIQEGNQKVEIELEDPDNDDSEEVPDEGATS